MAATISTNDANISATATWGANLGQNCCELNEFLQAIVLLRKGRQGLPYR